MTREDAVERLCDVYGGSFDITRCEEAELPLAVKMDFYVHNSKYVLSKKPSCGRPTASNMCICSPFRT